MKDFFEKHKGDILGAIFLFGYCGVWLTISTMFELSENQGVALLVVGSLAILAVFLRFRKDSSEQDKTVSALLMLSVIASPFVFLLYYLIGN